MSGKIVVITGSNTGLGKQTAAELAKLGATVIIACRDALRGKSAVEDIMALYKTAKVETMTLDLASFASIKQFAQTFKTKYSHLDILINNAGVMMSPKLLTADKLEMQIGVNHFGHFLLTNLLLDHLALSPTNAARIINVSSVGHTFFGAQTRGINFDDINSEREYDPYYAYGQSKLANVLFTYELQRRLKLNSKYDNIKTAVLHPGYVQSELDRHFTNVIARVFANIGAVLFARTSLQGAQTSLYCALKPDLEGGLYYDNCKAVKSSKLSYNADMQAKLWKVSEEITGITSPLSKQ